MYDMSESGLEVILKLNDNFLYGIVTIVCKATYEGVNVLQDDENTDSVANGD